MRTVHIVFETPLPNGSGADHRNLAVNASLSLLGQSSLFAVQTLFSGRGHYPERQPSYIEASLPNGLVDTVLRKVTLDDPDLYVVDGVFLSQIAERLASDGHRVIVDMHNIESALRQDVDRARYGWRAALYYRRRWALARAAEERLVGQVDRVWTCSSCDAATLSAMMDYQTPVDVVPNPIPSWCHDIPRRAPRDGAEINALFIGHLGYSPNIVAVRRLASKIFPAIRAVFPAAQLDICGRAPHKALPKLLSKRSGVTLIADPGDLMPYYDRATVALIPLTEGGGTRLKVLEAMALGVPVVATAKAVEGLDVVPGQTFLQAETDIEFVEAVSQLVNDTRLSNRLTDAGYTFALAHHGQAAIDQAVRTALAGDAD